MQNLATLSKKMPNLYLWHKDLNSVYIDCNTKLSNMYSIKNRLAVQGLTNDEIPCRAAEIAVTFQKEDQFIISSQVTHEFLTIAQCARDEWKIVLTTKTPLRDDNNAIIGTFGYGLDLSHITNHIVNIFKQTISSFGLNQSEHTLSKNFTTLNGTKIKLAVRESEILFFMLRGKTYKQIARILKLSVRTVEHYIDNIRIKFNCRTKSELIAHAIEQGLLEFMPPRFIHDPSSFILSE